MNIPLLSCTLRLVVALASGSFCVAAERHEPNPDTLHFASELAHRHSYLFSDEHRAELEKVNRELRAAAQQLRAAQNDNQREKPAAQMAAATQRLLELLKGCPRLLKLDLTAANPALEPPGPVELPGYTGSLLLRIDSGGEGTRFRASTADLSLVPGESSLVPVEAAPRGVTYAAVALEAVPHQSTLLRIDVRRSSVPSTQLPLTVTTPLPGRLRLTVLSDDTGEPTPAMVRLMWRTDGLQRRPSNGIEFAPQFDSQGHASGVRAANLPEPLNVCQRRNENAVTAPV